jgi:PEGA domain
MRIKLAAATAVIAAAAIIGTSTPASAQGRGNARGRREPPPAASRVQAVPRAVARPPVVVQQVRPVFRGGPPVRVVRPVPRTTFRLGLSYGYPAYSYVPYARPYSVYPPAYGYSYGPVYGGLRITGAPRNAQVYADGYYVGVVDNYDGIFQSLDLTPGPHRIEIRVRGYESYAVDVYIQPGKTLTFRADDY